MPTYFTLTQKGNEWLSNDAPDPGKHMKTLAALAELIEENDIPRTPVQVARIVSLPENTVKQHLTYLTQASYTKQAKIPQPSEKEQTPKIRIRPIEDLVAAELRTIESQKKYIRGPKGKAVHAKYEGSDKGKIKNVKYRESGKGKLVHKAYRLRRRLKELTIFLATYPDRESEIRPLITEVETRLTNLKED